MKARMSLGVSEVLRVLHGAASRLFLSLYMRLFTDTRDMSVDSCIIPPQHEAIL